MGLLLLLRHAYQLLSPAPCRANTHFHTKPTTKYAHSRLLHTQLYKRFL